MTDEWGWQAEFLDGPLEGREHERHFSGAFETALDLWFARIPRSPFPDAPEPIGGWMLVGLEPGIGQPVPPWPEQVHYRIDLSESSILAQPPRDGGDRGVARYRLVADEDAELRLPADVPPENVFLYIANRARAELLEAMKRDEQLLPHDRQVIEAMLDWLVALPLTRREEQSGG